MLPTYMYKFGLQATVACIESIFYKQMLRNSIPVIFCCENFSALATLSFYHLLMLFATTKCTILFHFSLSASAAVVLTSLLL